MNKKFLKSTAAMMTLCGMTMMSLTAVAAEAGADDYGDLAGQQRSQQRNESYAGLAQLETDADRQTFYAASGLGENSPYHTSAHLDCEAFVEAGIIDQDTADQIAAYANEKHATLHAFYTGKTDMAPADRAAYYQTKTVSSADPIGELINAKILTADQADALRSFIGE